MFKSITYQSGYIDGFCPPHSLHYTRCLFSFLDSKNNPAYYYPYNCRGILIHALYNKTIRKQLYWSGNGASGEHINPLFDPVYDYLNMVLCIRDINIDKITDSINYINTKINPKFNIKEDIMLDKFNIEQDDHQLYHLTGPREWQSSQPIISLLMGILKYSTEWVGQFSVTDIYRKLANSQESHITDDLNTIIKYWNINRENRKLGGGGLGFTHNYGIRHFLERGDKKYEKQEENCEKIVLDTPAEVAQATS